MRVSAPLRLSVGRQRAGSRILPHEVQYVTAIQKEMSDIRNNLLKLVGYIGNISPEALVEALEPVFEESQKLVPVDTGRLKRSGFLKAVKTATGASAALGYGFRGSPSYAGLVHEATWIPHRGITQAKFLSDPINRQSRQIIIRYADIIKRQTGIS